MKHFTNLFILLLLSSAILAQTAKVDTVPVYSKAMARTFNCVVIHPQPLTTTPLPVVYLLHGYSGAYDNWIRRVPELQVYAQQHNVIIACPDGGYSGWYFDSPVDATMRYETYIAKEVPAFIDSAYHTIRSREGRAITGLSMGGHGGLFLGFRHADFFGACGSMSGAVDLSTEKKSYNIWKLLGDTITHADNWNKYSVTTIVEHYSKDSIKIIIDCGVEDFFYRVNRALHEKMLRLKIPHDYIERPGKHDWTYWGNAVKYQLLFFKDYFYKKR